MFKCQTNWINSKLFAIPSKMHPCAATFRRFLGSSELSPASSLASAHRWLNSSLACLCSWFISKSLHSSTDAGVADSDNDVASSVVGLATTSVAGIVATSTVGVVATSGTSSTTCSFSFWFSGLLLLSVGCDCASSFGSTAFESDLDVLSFFSFALFWRWKRNIYALP